MREWNILVICSSKILLLQVWILDVSNLQDLTIRNPWLISTIANMIGNKGASFLSKGLKINKSLTVLNLSVNNIGEKGFKNICKGLLYNQTLRTLDVGCMYIINFNLHESKLLKNIKANDIGNQACKHLNDILQNKSQLSELKFGCKFFVCLLI